MFLGPKYARLVLLLGSGWNRPRYTKFGDDMLIYFYAILFLFPNHHLHPETQVSDLVTVSIEILPGFRNTDLLDATRMDVRVATNRGSQQQFQDRNNSFLSDGSRYNSFLLCFLYIITASVRLYGVLI